MRALRSHLDGFLPWTKRRVSNGAVEGMDNKIKSISHRSFGFRSAKNVIAGRKTGLLCAPGDAARVSVRANRSAESMTAQSIEATLPSRGAL